MERPKFYHIPRAAKYNPPGTRNNPHVWQPTGNRSPSPRKVYLGSPAADSGLKKGDMLVGIGGQSAPMSHKKATDMIRTSGNNLDVKVERKATVGAFSPPISPPNQPAMNYSGQLPRNTVGVIPSFETTPAGYLPVEQEKQIYRKEKRQEMDAVVNQPHRTFPMVQPKPKPIHDYPTGSYLKYMRDPGWRALPKHNVGNTDKLKHVMSTLSSNVDPEKVVHLQYNSPLNLYSADNVADTLMPGSKRMDRNSPNLNTRPQLTDFRQSPTFQLIQEQEISRGGSKGGSGMSQSSSPIPDYSDASQPAQSYSFKALSNSLLPHPNY